MYCAKNYSFIYPDLKQNNLNVETSSEIHQRLVKPLTTDEKANWLRKIWTSENAESHANGEPIELLWWYSRGGKAGTFEDVDIGSIVGDNNKYCGPCTLTANRKKEHSADAVIVSNGPLLAWQKALAANEEFELQGAELKIAVLDEITFFFLTMFIIFDFTT